MPGRLPADTRVELSVAAATTAQPLMVKPDPRVSTYRSAGLQREFELARKVEAAQLQVSAALD